MRIFGLVPLIVAVLFTMHGPAAHSQSTGLVFADDAAYQSIPLAVSPLMGSLPSQVDMSPSFPIPGQQAGQSSCVGWAIAYALKSYQERVERNWGLSNADHVFSPSHIYNQIRLGNGCQGGSRLIDALNLLRREGAVPMSSMPYDPASCVQLPTPAQRQAAGAFRIADWRRVNVQDETEVKSQLAAGFPVLIGMMVDQAFQGLGSGTYSQQGGQSLGGHAVVVVGYSDARHAFKIINSWGTTWGDGGYGWIDYDAFTRVVREGYVAQDIVSVSPSPTPPVAPTPVPQNNVTPTMPMATMFAPVVQHNMSVYSPTVPGGVSPGMAIALPGMIQNAAGKRGQIVVRFSYLNGPLLAANPSELSFRDAVGAVATGTSVFAVSSDNYQLSGVVVSIPYYAMNFPPTNYAAVHQLALSATLYIDNFPVAQSPTVPFSIRY